MPKLHAYGKSELAGQGEPPIDVLFIAQEYCYHGDFFDLVAQSKQFDEQIAKYYFKQLVEALDYCHCQGIYHMDIKLNNIALDENF